MCWQSSCRDPGSPKAPPSPPKSGEGSSPGGTCSWQGSRNTLRASRWMCRNEGAKADVTKETLRPRLLSISWHCQPAALPTEKVTENETQETDAWGTSGSGKMCPGRCGGTTWPQRGPGPHVLRTRRLVREEGSVSSRMEKGVLQTRAQIPAPRPHQAGNSTSLRLNFLIGGLGRGGGAGCKSRREKGRRYP